MNEYLFELKHGSTDSKLEVALQEAMKRGDVPTYVLDSNGEVLGLLGPGGDTLAISGGVGGGITAEQAMDTVNGMLAVTAPLAKVYNDASDTLTLSVVSATTSVAGSMSAADKTKLDGIAAGATANDTDGNLKNRANHTGTQEASTISDFNEAVYDNIAPMLVQGTNVTLTKSDATNTITIAATAGAGGVSSVTGTAPIVSSGGSTPAISISPATALAAGSMSAADKAKLDALSGDPVPGVDSSPGWVSLIGGKLWVRASGTAAEKGAISAVLDQATAATSKYVITAGANVVIESVTARLEAAETAGRTSLIVDIPSPGGATSVDLAPRPVAFRLNPASAPAWAIASTASNIAVTGGRMTLETTGHTAGSAQGMTVTM